MRPILSRKEKGVKCFGESLFKPYVGPYGFERSKRVLEILRNPLMRFGMGLCLGLQDGFQSTKISKYS